jgi:hypothetical protein
MFSWQLVSLNYYLKNNQQDLIILKSEGLIASWSVLQKYRDCFTDKSPDFLGLADFLLYNCLRL